MLLRHGFQYLLARGLPGVLNFAAIAVYSRLLNPEEYGAYTLTIAAVSAVDALLLHWLRLALLRFLPMQGGEQRNTLATVLKLYGAVTIGVSLLAVGGSWLFVADPFTRQLVLLGAALFMVQGGFELTVERERSELSPRRYGTYALLRSVIALGVGAGLAAAGLGAVGVLLGLVAALLFPLVALGGLSRWLRSARDPYDPRLSRRLTAYGLPLAATSILAFLVSGSDRFMLAAFIDTAAAGQYAVGHDLAQFTLGLLLNIVNLAAYPLIVSAFEREGEEAARRMLRWTLHLMLLVGLPAAVGMVALAPNIATVFVGADFREAAALIIPGIAIAASLAGFKAFYVDLSFQLRGRTIIQVWVLLITALVNIGLNLVLIPLWGIVGAVYATVAAHAVAIVLSLVLSRTTMRLPMPDRQMLPIFAATALMLVGLLFVRHHVGLAALIGQVGVGALTYLACLWLVDRRFLGRLVSYGDQPQA